MLTTANKQRILTRLLGLSKRQLEVIEPEPRPILEQLLYAVCREGASRRQADRAFKELQTAFYDWNEVRVSAAREIEEALGDLPDAETKAIRIITILQEVFESTYSFDLEGLHKKGVKQAEKQLERYQGVNRYVLDSTVQLGLGGHAVPVDPPMQRALQRLDMLDGEVPAEGEEPTGLAHLVPKARAPMFGELVSALAHQYCWEESPCCSSCPMNDTCTTGQTMLAAPRSQRRAKPK
jgi:endonuclease-3